MEYNRVEESGWRKGKEIHRVRDELVLTTSRHEWRECSESKVHKKMTEMSGKEISQMKLEGRKAVESSKGLWENRDLELLRGLRESRTFQPSRGLRERTELEPFRGFGEKRVSSSSSRFEGRRAVELSKELWESRAVEPSREFGERRAVELPRGFKRERREVEALREYKERRTVEPSRGCESLKSPLNNYTKHWAEPDSSVNDCKKIEYSNRKIPSIDKKIEPFRGFDKGFIENAKYAFNKVKEGQAHRGAGDEVFAADRNEFIDNGTSRDLGKTSCNPKRYEVDGFKSYGVKSPDKRSNEPSKEIGNQFLKPSTKPFYGIEKMNPCYEGSDPKRQQINSKEVKFDRPGMVEPLKKDGYFNNVGMEPIRNTGPDPFISEQTELEKRNCIKPIGVEQKRFLDSSENSGAEFNNQYHMKPSQLERIAKVINKSEHVNPSKVNDVQSSNILGGVFSSKIQSSVESTNMLGQAKVSQTADAFWPSHNFNAVPFNNTAISAPDGFTNTKWGAGSTHTSGIDGTIYNVDAVKSTYNPGSVGSSYTMTGVGSTDTKRGVGYTHTTSSDRSTYNVDAVKSTYDSGSVGSSYTMTGVGSTDTKRVIGSTSTQGSQSLNITAGEDADAEMARVELEIKHYEKELKLLRHQRLAKELEEERKLAMNNQQNQQWKNEQTIVEEHNSSRFFLK